MTARWRSSSCSTSFPATCSAATQDLCQRPLAREVAAAPSTRRGRADRSRPARIPLSAVHAFGASGRPVALHRAVRAAPANAESLKYAEHHADIIRGSGAFLTATASGPRDHAEEQAFLDAGGFSG
jgi:uncharacterized protein (DUF924 family)